MTYKAVGALCEFLCFGPSLLDASHIREGVCIRIEHPDMFTVAKLKNHDFLEMEANAKDDETTIDIEESS